MNAHRWRLFWEAAGDRSLRVTKVKSHLDEAAARAAGVDRLHWLANSRADELAEEAAREAQLAPETVQEVHRLDKEAREVQEHLVSVALEVARNAPQLYGASTRGQRLAEASERARQRKTALLEAERLTEHRLCPKSGRCLACLRGPTRETPKLEFLRSACTRRPWAIHASHDLQQTRGLWWCATCGGTGSSHFRKLAEECGAPTATGKLALRRLLDGKRPYHVKAWPDEAEDLIVD